jgi:hypothetical protein
MSSNGFCSKSAIIFSEDQKSLLIYREDKQVKVKSEEEGGRGDDKS